MNNFFTTLSLIALLLASPAAAAELVLRPQATEHGSVVRLGDVADISAASSSEVRQLATTPLFPAPAAGTDYFLTVEKLRDLLAARGIDTGRLSISGALVVEIGDTPVTSSSKQVLKPADRTAAEIELTIKQAITQRLNVASPQHRWLVDVLLTKYQLEQLDSMPTQISVRELQPLRSGRVRFQVSDGQRDWEIVAKLTQVSSVAVAKQSIERGQLVRAVDVELREHEGNLPNGSIDDLQQAIGQVAQRSFKPDDLVLKSYLRAPWQVRRGETVNAFVRTGNIVVRTRAIAKQDGAMGELIIVETLADKQRLDVTVSGPSEVTVYATGGRATDYASLDRQGTKRR